MSDVAEALAVLQFGDSFFPSGAVSFSWGLEGLSDSGVVTDADAVRAFVIGQLRARWAEFDRPVVVAAHRARMSLEEVAAIDASGRDANALRRTALRLAADGRGHAVGVRQARHRRGCRLSREGEAGRGVRPSRARCKAICGGARA